jgi:hypothetical protein
MTLEDILKKIRSFFKSKDSRKAQYEIKTTDIHIRDIPRSVYLVIKKYGWKAFFIKA